MSPPGVHEPTCSRGATKPRFVKVSAADGVKFRPTAARMSAPQRHILCGSCESGCTASGVVVAKAACAAASACASRKLPRPPCTWAARASPAHRLPDSAAACNLRTITSKDSTQPDPGNVMRCSLLQHLAVANTHMMCGCHKGLYMQLRQSGVSNCRLKCRGRPGHLCGRLHCDCSMEQPRRKAAAVNRCCQQTARASHIAAWRCLQVAKAACHRCIHALQ
jgi:hypothetical protein